MIALEYCWSIGLWGTLSGIWGNSVMSLSGRSRNQKGPLASEYKPQQCQDEALIAWILPTIYVCVTRPLVKRPNLKVCTHVQPGSAPFDT